MLLIILLLLPLLDYGDVRYLDLTEDRLNKLERLQNLCIRYIFGLRKYDHISEYRSRLKWVEIRDRHHLHIRNPWLSLQHGGANSTKGSGVPSKEAFGYFTKRGLVINKYNFESKEQFNKINDDRMTDVKLKVYSQNVREIRSPPSYKGNYSKSKSIEVLVGNEFSPIWISLHKSITNDIDIFSSEMAQKRAELGPIPLTPYDQQIWESLVAKYEKRTNGLKTKIAIYNLFLPITNKPLLEFNYSNICSEILQYGNFKGRFTLGVKNTGQNKVKKDRVIEKLESFVEFLIKRYVKIKEFYKRGR